MAKRAHESAHFSIKIFSSRRCLSAVVPCLRRTGHPFAASGRSGPSQKIELVFSASPETVSEEPQESFNLHRSLGTAGGTWQSARFTILKFSFRCGFLCRSAGEHSHRFKVSLLAIYGHKICNQLASYSESCAIGIHLLSRILIYQG